MLLLVVGVGVDFVIDSFAVVEATISTTVVVVLSVVGDDEDLSLFDTSSVPPMHGISVPR